MMSKKVVGCIAAIAMALAAGSASAASLTPKEKLGKNLFFDVRLSDPPGQACAACHSPGAGFNGIGAASVAVYEGAVPGHFGNRNPPAAAYASFSPTFHLDPATGGYVGGQFWDGRAATLKDQAKGPFLNPVEQNATMSYVVDSVAASNYRPLFLEVYPGTDFSDVATVYDNIADAIATYEGSTEVNGFSSKYDWYLKDPAKYPLSKQEQMGLALFNGKGQCFLCHPSQPGASAPLFTDFTYDNLGIPKASDPSVAPDLGLGAIVSDPAQNGKFKVPTLRNIGVAPPYGHNGYFKTLKEIVNFYNTRDVKNTHGNGKVGNWPAPEVPENVNRTVVGNLLLSDSQEDAIVAFLMTLTDGYVPPNPR